MLLFESRPIRSAHKQTRSAFFGVFVLLFFPFGIVWLFQCHPLLRVDCPRQILFRYLSACAGLEAFPSERPTRGATLFLLQNSSNVSVIRQVYFESLGNLRSISRICRSLAT